MSWSTYMRWIAPMRIWFADKHTRLYFVLIALIARILCNTVLSHSVNTVVILLWVLDWVKFNEALFFGMIIHLISSTACRLAVYPLKPEENVVFLVYVLVCFRLAYELLYEEHREHGHRCLRRFQVTETDECPITKDSLLADQAGLMRCECCSALFGATALAEWLKVPGRGCPVCRGVWVNQAVYVTTL